VRQDHARNDAAVWGRPSSLSLRQLNDHFHSKTCSIWAQTSKELMEPQIPCNSDKTGVNRAIFTGGIASDRPFTHVYHKENTLKENSLLSVKGSNFAMAAHDLVGDSRW